MRTDVLLHLLRATPTVAKVIEKAQKAAQGDLEAMQYMQKDALYESLDALVRPGAGEVTRNAYHSVRDYLLGGDIVDAEFRVLEDGPPWSGFLKRLMNTDSGAHVLLGSMGTGKTELAKKLAWHWHQRNGYKVEFVNVYPSDLPDFGSIMHIDTLIGRMRRLQAYLKSQATLDEGEEGEDYEDKEYKGPAGPPPGRRIIIIDEAGLSLGNTAADAGRRAALQALAQSRHAQWIVLFLAQWAGQLPLPLLGQSTVWVKKPRGDEAETDRDNPVVRKLWLDAGKAFEKLKASPYYAPPHADSRAWAYVYCQSLNGKAGYQGLLPFTPYQAADKGDKIEIVEVTADEQ